MKLVASILGWTSAILVAALNVFAGVSKFLPVAPDSPQSAMMQSMGITPNIAHVLGVVELVSAVLFLIPRTSTIGFVLLVGYMSGVTATLITHSQDATIGFIALALLTVSAFVRNPELRSRLAGRPVLA
jgi:uncharacterized membrane protein YphA (DoxX/SURF4 family)